MDRTFTAALFTIAKTWKQPQFHQQMNGLRRCGIYTHTHTYIYIYTNTMEYYSAIKKNKVMPYAAICMELKILILIEVSQKEKNKYHTLSLIFGI